MNTEVFSSARRSLIACGGIALAFTFPAQAENSKDLAQKLTNPLADLISMPVQANIDFGVGPGDGHRMYTNVQPVIPFEFNENWNIISRTILPVIDQQGLDAVGDRSDAFGLGDTVQSVFFSPKSGDPFVWGVGPVFLLPTATDTSLGGQNWGAGPTGVILKIDGPWTYGALANHLWDFGGANNRSGYNTTFIQPFLAYTTSQATSFTVNSESTYDWQQSQWRIPINFQVSQLIKIGGKPVSIYAGARYYAEKEPNGPDWGLRLGFTLLLPR